MFTADCGGQIFKPRPKHQETEAGKQKSLQMQTALSKSPEQCQDLCQRWTGHATRGANSQEPSITFQTLGKKQYSHFNWNGVKRWMQIQGYTKSQNENRNGFISNFKFWSWKRFTWMLLQIIYMIQMTRKCPHSPVSNPDLPWVRHVKLAIATHVKIQYSKQDYSLL